MEQAIAMTEEQAAMYEALLRDEPKLAKLPVLGVDMHTVNGMRVLCIATRVRGEEMFAHYTLDDNFGPAEMAAVTQLHGMDRFSVLGELRMEGLVL